MTRNNIVNFVIFSVVCIVSVLILPYPGNAADITLPLQIPFWGQDSVEICVGENCRGIPVYVNLIYHWLVGFAAVLAVLALTWGGVRWLTSGGESGKIEEARKVIGNAVIGLLIALGSYAGLTAINPSLVSFRPLAISPVSAIKLALAPKEKVSTGGTLVRSECRGTKKEGTRCSTDKPCECESGVCTVGGVCGGLAVASAEKIGAGKGLCCFVVDDAGSKRRRQMPVANSRACLDTLLATGTISLAYGRFFCPNVTGVTATHCWKKDAGSSDPAYYERSEELCKTFIDFSLETNTSGTSSTGTTAAPVRSGPISPE